MDDDGFAVTSCWLVTWAGLDGSEMAIKLEDGFSVVAVTQEKE